MIHGLLLGLLDSFHVYLQKLLVQLEYLLILLSLSSHPSIPLFGLSQAEPLEQLIVYVLRQKCCCDAIVPEQNHV